MSLLTGSTIKLIGHKNLNFLSAFLFAYAISSMAMASEPVTDPASAVSAPTPTGASQPEITQNHTPGQKRSGEPTGESTLMRAAQQGNLAAVDAELAAGSDVNLQDRRGRTALAYAIANGHEEIVKVLLKHGASIELADETGATPLMQAIPKGNLAILKLLLDKGANVHARTSSSKMPPQSLRMPTIKVRLPKETLRL